MPILSGNMSGGQGAGALYMMAKALGKSSGSDDVDDDAPTAIDRRAAQQQQGGPDDQTVTATDQGMDAITATNTLDKILQNQQGPQIAKAGQGQIQGGSMKSGPVGSIISAVGAALA